jgi:L-histidine N-alpha-methyltransferase
VHGVVGDFEHHLVRLPEGRRRLFAFLGSSIGNLTGAQRAGFLSALHGLLGPGEALLLGADLVKDPTRLERAYNDSQGVTAEFNRNVLSVVNRELGGDFRPERFTHVARWDAEHEWIEMLLRSDVDQQVRVAALDLEVEFAAGEEMRTEISDKFRRSGLQAELDGAGFDLAEWWEDPAGDFALSLSFSAAE